LRTGHGTPNDNPKTEHDQQGYVPFASLHQAGAGAGISVGGVGQAKKVFDDQGEHAGDHDAVHPLERVDLRIRDREFLVEPGDVLARVADLILHLWKPAGLLLHPLEPVVTDNQALGRGARPRLRRAGFLQRVVQFDQHRAHARSPGSEHREGGRFRSSRATREEAHSGIGRQVGPRRGQIRLSRAAPSR
jgi:hypothetical protein